MRGFVGGPRDQEIIQRSDAELIEVARSSFVELLGVRPDAKPLFARVYRWVGGMPQYTMGHLDRIEELEARCAEIPGLRVGRGRVSRRRRAQLPRLRREGRRQGARRVGHHA